MLFRSRKSRGARPFGVNKTSLNDRNLKEYLVIISQWLSIALAFSIPVSTALDSILIASLLLTVLASNTNAVAQVIKSNPVARACALLFVLLMIGMSYGDAPLDIKVGILGKYSDLALVPLRGGSGKLDSPISDNLAQSKLWRPRHTEEQAHEKDEKESRTWIQGQGGDSSDQG